jgi:antitoxin (DNA-binding transcriptional repressor) of toxin-antitoxin stability system
VGASSWFVRSCTNVYDRRMVTMTVSEARAALPELIHRVEGGEEVTITRHGRAVAVVVRPDALGSRRAGALLAKAEQVHELLTDARAAALPTATGLTPQRADELVAEVRAGRESR